MKLPEMILTGCLAASFAGTGGCGTAEMASDYSMVSLEGVWISYKLSSGGTALNSVRYIVFDGNGYSIDALSRKGLYGITADDLSQYTIGTYSLHDRQLEAATPYTSCLFEWTDVNTLTRPGYTYQFHRCIVKNNLRLSGSWTTFQTTDDPWLDEPGVRLVLILNYSDGRVVKKTLPNMTDSSTLVVIPCINDK